VSTATLIGAVLGLGLGYVQAWLISGVVVRALEATDRSVTEVEKADYRARVRLFWLIVHLVFMGGGIVIGVGIARWLFG
jgi:ABC-type antimicrobial peptide transport system permease subunit